MHFGSASTCVLGMTRCCNLNPLREKRYKRKTVGQFPLGMKLNRSKSYPLEHAVDIRARHPKGKALLSTFIVQWHAILELIESITTIVKKVSIAAPRLLNIFLL